MLFRYLTRLLFDRPGYYCIFFLYCVYHTTRYIRLHCDPFMCAFYYCYCHYSIINICVLGFVVFFFCFLFLASMARHIRSISTLIRTTYVAEMAELSDANGWCIVRCFKTAIVYMCVLCVIVCKKATQRPYETSSQKQKKKHNQILYHIL